MDLPCSPWCWNPMGCTGNRSTSPTIVMMLQCMAWSRVQLFSPGLDNNAPSSSISHPITVLNAIKCTLPYQRSVSTQKESKRLKGRASATVLDFLPFVQMWDQHRLVFIDDFGVCEGPVTFVHGFVFLPVFCCPCCRKHLRLKKKRTKPREKNRSASINWPVQKKE